MLKGFTIAGQFGKTLGYITWGVNGALKLVGTVGRKTYDLVANRDKYDVEITTQGYTIKSEKDMTASEVQRTMESMGKFGDIELHVVRREKYDKSNNTRGDRKNLSPDKPNTEDS